MSERNYDAYYMLTMLYVIVVPFVAILIIGIVSGLYGLILPIPFFIAIIMFLYAYFCIGKLNLQKPNSMFGLYLPVFVYFIWQMFLSVIFVIFVAPDYDGVISYSLLSLNGGYIDFNAIDHKVGWHLQLIMVCIYNLTFLGGFMAGERLAFYKTKVTRKPFPKNFWWILSCGVAILLISQGIWFYKQRNVIFY